VKASSTIVLVLVGSLDYCGDGQEQKVAVTVTYVQQEAEQLVLSGGVSRIFQAPCCDMKLALKKYNVLHGSMEGLIRKS
jgi:hypothetical protein